MKVKYLIIILIIIPFILAAKTSDHIVISEIKITGGTGKTTDEFIELYNPTENNILLNGWSLYKQTSSGTEYVLVDDFGNLEIKSYGYLLITHPTGYLGNISADIVYSSSSSASSNNSVYLKDNIGNTIDLVGMGTSSTYEFETTVNPGSNKSIERKADQNSDEDSMNIDEFDYWRGNSFDSGNNKNDFIQKIIPEPQNSISEIEFLDNVVISNEDTLKRESDKIVITELFPNPVGSDNEEFIEILNRDSEAIDLKDWQIGDNSTNKFRISNDDFSSTIINPGEYLVIEKELSGISLNNTTDTVFLYDYLGKVIQAVEYIGCQEGKSFIYYDGSWVWSDDISPGQANVKHIDNNVPVAKFDLENTNYRVGQSVTFDASQSFDEDGDNLEYIWKIGTKEIKGEKVEYVFGTTGNYEIKLSVIDQWGDLDSQIINVSVTDFDYSELIIITEILPSCAGPDEECEFIELLNTDSREINLFGWLITDTKKDYTIDKDIIIESGDYLVINRSESKITLNNSNDIIYLIDPQGKIINGVEYKDSKSDFSFSFSNKVWHWTDTPTPGEKNIIQNESVEIEAELEVNKEPINISIKDISEEYLGRIIIVSGEVESAKKTGIYLMDQGGYTIRVYIQNKTGIPWPDVPEGDHMQVTGLLDKTSAGLRLLPQKAEDIFITKSDNVENQSKDPQVLGLSTDKEILDIASKDQSQKVIRNLYILIGFLLLVIIGLSINYFINKKQSESIEEDIY